MSVDPVGRTAWNNIPDFFGLIVISTRESHSYHILFFRRFYLFMETSCRSQQENYQPPIV